VSSSCGPDTYISYRVFPWDLTPPSQFSTSVMAITSTERDDLRCDVANALSSNAFQRFLILSKHLVGFGDRTKLGAVVTLILDARSTLYLDPQSSGESSIMLWQKQGVK
jgi:hypothetical protein